MALNVNFQEDKWVLAGLVMLVIMLVSLLVGGQSAQIAFSYAAITFIALYALLGCQSSAERQGTNAFALVMAGLLVILGVAFALLWYFHFQNPSYSDPTYWLGFPRATAIVVYLLWMPPALYLMFSYPYLFDEYIWDADQVERFKQLGRTSGGDEE